jgi:hypothetical protein
MTPVRTQIRHALINCLRDCSSLEGRVFEPPIHAFDPSQLPLLTVTIEKDQVVDDWTSILAMALAGNVLVQMRELSLSLKILVKATIGFPVADRLDAIASEVTTHLLADRSLGGLCKDIRFNETSEITISDEGEPPMGSLILHGVVLYRIAEPLPQFPLT